MRGLPFALLPFVPFHFFRGKAGMERSSKRSGAALRSAMEAVRGARLGSQEGLPEASRIDLPGFKNLEGLDDRDVSLGFRLLRMAL